MPNPTIIEIGTDGAPSALVPTSFRELGRQEDALEEILAESPELLELEAHVTGIRGPYAVFRQRDLANALENTVIPDLILLCASGHVVIVEVKLGDNPDLRNRRVLAQVIDYAGAFVDRSDSDLLAVFGGHTAAPTWAQFVEAAFSDEPHIEMLATRLLHRFQTGEVDLVVACDRAPAGLSSLLAGVSRQRALPFELSLVEVTPYLRSGVATGPVLLVSRAILRTETVSRTVVTVRYESGSVQRPSVRVETTPLDEIEQHLVDAAEARFWTNDEIIDAFTTAEPPVVRQLFELARHESMVGQFASSGRKRRPAFGFYHRGTGPDREERTTQIFHYNLGESRLIVYLDMIETLVPSDRLEEFVTRLDRLFPTSRIRELREPSIDLRDVAERFDEFRELVLWLRDGG